MRRLLLATTALLAACHGTPSAAPDAGFDPVPLVDTRLGSGGFAFSAGNCSPGASVPNGMVDVGPDTAGKYGDLSFLHYDGYWAGDDTIQGFSQLHLSGTGATDFAVLSTMPLVTFDPNKLTAIANGAKFDKSTEVATPGYYAATLSDGIRAELTATAHVASHRYTFPESAQHPALLFDLQHGLPGADTVVDAEAHLDASQKRIEGHLRTSGGMSGGFDLYFVAQLERAWSRATVWNAATAPAEGTDVSGAGASFALEWDDPAPVQVAIALSYVSSDGAAANLAYEEPSTDLDATRAAAEAAWRERLSSVRITGGADADRALFYSALHHLFVMPQLVSDVDGRFIYQGQRGQVANHWQLSSLSLWDTYRTADPLYALLAPDAARDLVKSLDEMARLGGAFPKWPLATSDSGSMVGSSADVVIADAYLRGVHDVDIDRIYQRLCDAALAPVAPAGGRGGRAPGYDDYAALGYVSADGGTTTTVSVTLEYAQDDFALSNLAAALGHGDDAAALLERSRGYRKLFDPDTRLLRPHLANGALAQGPFDPTVWDDGYVEADAYQSLWGAPHDVSGTAQLLGGNDAAVAALERFFEQAKQEDDALRARVAANPSDVLSGSMPRTWYWAGNEPDLHTPYLFALLGRPDLTQQWVAWARAGFYAATPEGLPGNDDGGTMSAWYLFSALGFYPLVGSDTYIVGTPRFPKVELAVPGGAFTIEARGVSDANVFVQSAQLDGVPLTRPTFPSAAIRAGGSLTFVMGPQPSQWGR